MGCVLLVDDDRIFRLTIKKAIGRCDIMIDTDDAQEAISLLQHGYGEQGTLTSVC